MNYKNQFIKRRIDNLLKVKLAGKGFSRINCNNVLCYRYGKRGDYEEIVKQLLSLYYSNTNKARNFERFYFWIKDYNFSKKDLEVFDIYSKIVSEYGIDKVDIKIESFSNGRVEGLLDKLKMWAGECGNSEADLIENYFVLIIPVAYEFNRRIITKAKALLEDYGWSLFLEAMDKSEDSFLIPSEIEIEKEKELKELFGNVFEARNELLERGDVESFDELGRRVKTELEKQAMLGLKKDAIKLLEK